MGRGDGIGSNSWVVAGEHTVSGKPLLANDPHLDTSIPGVWYQMGLHCRTVNDDCPFDVSGFTFSGMPGVVVGHNRDIAWGMTKLDADVSDLYLEKVSGKTYLYGGRQVPLAERDEVIRIAGESSKLITVRSTRHGPLLSDVSAELSSVGANAAVPTGSPDRENGYAVALSWTALTPRPTADAVFAFDTASNWTEFREAARRFAVPSQNLVYADTQGNIGYQAPGAIPIRRGNRAGDYPSAGWVPANDWSGRYVPFDELPRLLNPSEGFIVSANQAATGPDYPWSPHGLPGPGIPQRADPRPDQRRHRRRQEARCLGHGEDAAGHVQPGRTRPGAPPDAPADDLGVLRRRAAAAGRLGLHPAGRLGGGGVLQRGLAQRPASRLRRPAARVAVARRRRSLGRRGEQPAARARQPVVGRRRHRQRRGGPRPDPDRGDARRPRRADPQDVGEPEEVDLGPPAPDGPGETLAGSGRPRRPQGPLQPRSLRRGRGHHERERHRLERRRRGTTSPPLPPCGWWSTSTTPTAPGG